MVVPRRKGSFARRSRFSDWLITQHASFHTWQVDTVVNMSEQDIGSEEMATSRWYLIEA